MPSSAESESNFRTILGIRFFTGAPADAARIAINGGLVVAPAAPALVEMERDVAYREALLNTDFAITDSGFMVLIWNLLKRERITRVSGLEYLKLLVAQPEFKKPGGVFWIMPTDHARARGLAWLNSRGVPATISDTYIAPRYTRGQISDANLLATLQQNRPSHIVIALGGGVQEKLGYHIKQNAGYKPGIHCIGAAIGFLSGDQVNIPDWADHLFLGWLLRCLSQPTKFLPRYWRARRLLPILFKYREKVPALRS
jgi:N-acetylglucosaminyldiphosphoundecaprenol N-acetyl-beta-D-mannosaminyltransferase